MAFESLTERLNGVFKKLRGKGKLNEADIKAAMREVRMALLEADVNYKVAKDFCAQVSDTGSRRDDIPEDVLHGEQSRGVDVEHGIKPGVPVAYCIEKADRCDGSFGKRKHNLYQDLCIICSIDNSRLLQALGNPVEEISHDQKVPGIDQAGKNHSPAGINKAYTFDQDECRNHSTGKQHGKKYKACQKSPSF